MRKYILVFIAALLTHSCSSPEKKAGSSADSTAVTVSGTFPDTTRRIFKGLYTSGNEVSTFRDCASGKVFWLNDSLTSMRAEYDKTNRFPPYPYESVYAEVRGYLAGKSGEGYAADYENVLVVTELQKMEVKNFRTECYNYEFIVLGNEPFWSLDIIPEEHRIVLKEAGEEKVHEFIYSPANIGGGVYRYEASNPASDKLVVVIRQEECSDGMSDRVYNYSAEVSFNGKVLKGCAIKKGDSFPDMP